MLLITVDTMRADRLSCYGAKETATPNIDLLAANGVRFENVVAPTPITLPSHASLMTGLDPPRHGVRDNGGFRLGDEIVTLAEVLAGSGYTTGAFVAALPLDSRFGLDQGFGTYDDALPAASSRQQIGFAQRPAAEVADATLAWLRSNAGVPWFAWVHFFDPHFPYEPPLRFRGASAGGPDASYRGEVAYVDEQVGRIVSFLDRAELSEHTLVVFTADHGESLGEHGELTHGVFGYESTLRVPLIVSPRKPRTVAPRVRLVDVAPTVLEALGLSFPGRVDGHSLRPLMEGRGDETTPESYFEALATHLNLQWAPLRGFQSGTYKFIDLPIPELYDLATDPRESRNLCDDRATCEKWKKRFRQFAGSFTEVGPTITPSAEVRAQLEALGYIGGGGGGERAPASFGAADDPKNLIDLYNRINLAMTRYARGDDAGALEILDEVIATRPDASLAYLKAAGIHAERGDQKQSVAVLEQATRNGAGTSFVERELGLRLVAAGKVREGIEHLHRALRLEPDSVDILEALARAYLAGQDLRRGEQVLRRALAIDPSSTSSLTQLAAIFLLQERWEDAAREFSAAVEHDPRLAEGHTGLGLAHAGVGNMALATASWRRALEVNRDEFDAMLHLAIAYLDAGDLVRARPLLEEFSARAPADRYGEELAEVRSALSRLPES